MTLQRRDTLTYKGSRYMLNRDIFRTYFEANPERKPKKIGFNSNLHRGYFSEFKIVDKQLIAVDIRVNFDFDRDTGEYLSKSVIADALSHQRACTWFSGILLMYDTQIENTAETEYLKMEVVEGMLVKVHALSNQEYDDLDNHAYDYL